MNSNLPPIRKVGPAVAPRPKNIKIQAGRVVRINDSTLDFAPQLPSEKPPSPPEVQVPVKLESTAHRFGNSYESPQAIYDHNNNNSNNIKLTNNDYYNEENNRNSLPIDLPQPPSPSVLKNFNELNLFETNDKYTTKVNTSDLHADLYLVKNSTINVSSDSSNRPTITITARNPNPPLKNTSYDNEEPRMYNIPIQHIPAATAKNNNQLQTIAINNHNNNNSFFINNNNNNNKPNNPDQALKPNPTNITKKPNNSNINDQLDLVQDLLMKNLIGSNDPNFEGICMKCGENILSPDIGLKAMQQLFHVKCFCCVSCGLQLSEFRPCPCCGFLKDKHFYAIDHKPFCENCYMRMLEKCSVCSNPITDRILRATGKPFHPECFVCTQCSKNLDGIPFTVDASNRIHCIECFHNKYAPRCYMCHLPITPEVGQEETTRVVALDKSFHLHCYKCEDCGCPLSANSDKISGCYPLDDHIFCRNCNILRVRNLKIPQTIIPINTAVAPRSTDL